MPSLCALRSVLFLSLSALVVVVASCDRPRTVTVSAAGSEKLALKGDVNVTGTTTRTLTFQGQTVEKGSAVSVIETWLVRKEPGTPPSYRVSGLYDPAQRAEGFVLPPGSVDVYFMTVVEPERRVQLAVPQADFQRAP